MKTITYSPTGNAIDELSLTEVTRIEFDHHKNLVRAHSTKDGVKEIPFSQIRQID